ncbi:glycoside hydrolase family 32 protein [Corynebacterium phoceense]|uniref:glycoside hydrolase family 32 protein n=1 Tax=Corynebacterium phoceense TaxID=1686286 RepID=UPI0034CE94B5
MSYRPHFHVSPPAGRLNDPNGMFVDGEDLHLYYQHDPGYPLAPKRTGWAHTVVSLTRPERPRHFPNVLYPDHPYDAHGCYSGGAVRDGDDLWLFYTGNLKVDGRRIPSQNRVRVTDLGPEGGFYELDPHNPVIPDTEPGFTGHFRDPQIVREADGRWRMVLGAQREDETGALVMYRSTDLAHWDFEGEVTFVGDVPDAYMWECPNLLELSDAATGATSHVLVVCPQFPGRDECGYIVGHLEGTTFTVTEGYRILDHGHNFYAPQLIAYDEGGVLVGWMGMPARDATPTVESEGWVHTLTVPRQVTLRDGALYQEPVWEIPGSLTTRELGTYELTAAGEVCLRVDWDGAQLTVARPRFAGDAAEPGTAALSVTPEEAASASAAVVPGEWDTRTAECGAGELVLSADGCAVEIFGGDGQAAFAVPVFAPGGAGWDGWRRV